MNVPPLNDNWGSSPLTLTVISPEPLDVVAGSVVPPKLRVTEELGAKAQVSPSEALTGVPLEGTFSVLLVEHVVGVVDAGGDVDPDAPARAEPANRNPEAPSRATAEVAIRI